MSRKKLFDLARELKGSALTPADVELGDKWMDLLGLSRSDGMQVSEKGLALIKEFEGCVLKAYKCPADIWTIGYGHTRNVKPGQTITQFEADELLRMDLEDHDISDLLGDAPTTQDQFDAMTSLAFNIGLTRFAGSTVLKRHKLGNRLGAANAFLMWRLSNGKVLPGLVRRREAERKLFLGEA